MHLDEIIRLTDGGLRRTYTCPRGTMTLCKRG